MINGQITVIKPGVRGAAYRAAAALLSQHGFVFVNGEAISMAQLALACPLRASSLIVRIVLDQVIPRPLVAPLAHLALVQVTVGHHGMRIELGEWLGLAAHPAGLHRISLENDI